MRNCSLSLLEPKQVPQLTLTPINNGHQKAGTRLEVQFLDLHSADHYLHAHAYILICMHT